MLQCIAVCCSVLQYVAVCCSMLQYAAVCCNELHLTSAPRLIHESISSFLPVRYRSEGGGRGQCHGRERVCVRLFAHTHMNT